MLRVTLFFPFESEMDPVPVAGEHEPLLVLDVSAISDIGRPVTDVSTLSKTFKSPPLKP